MSSFKLSWKVTKESNGTLIRDFLKAQQISKAALTDIKFQGGRIVLNGAEQTVRAIVKENDWLEVYFPEETASVGLKAEQIPLDIVYEDEYVIIINKPAEMSTIPSREHPTGSLANALLGYYLSKGIQATTHIVTRLDRDTSGLVLIAKHRHIHHLLSQDQRHHRVKRRYEALVHGVLSKPVGTINEPIGRKPDSIIERWVTPDGQQACTHYQVKEIFPTFTHVSLTLETGRTHQIRVHMSHLGHPLIGDDLYGGSRTLLSRQALHCCELTFTHPIEKRTFEFRMALASDMQALMNRSRTSL